MIATLPSSLPIRKPPFLGVLYRAMRKLTRGCTWQHAGAACSFSGPIAHYLLLYFNRCLQFEKQHAAWPDGCASRVASPARHLRPIAADLRHDDSFHCVSVSECRAACGRVIGDQPERFYQIIEDGCQTRF